MMRKREDDNFYKEKHSILTQYALGRMDEGELGKKLDEIDQQEHLQQLKAMFANTFSPNFVEEIFVQQKGNHKETLEWLLEMAKQAEEEERRKCEEAKYEDLLDTKFCTDESSSSFTSWIKQAFIDQPKTVTTLDKGLSNFIGENNCFLNVIIQILWHMLPFSSKFTTSSEHQHDSQDINGESCVFCALKVLFAQFGFSEESRVPPTVLRKALSVLYQPKFQLGKMDDAAEVYDALLTCLHNSLMSAPHNLTPTSCNPPCLVDSVFSMHIREYMKCSNCNEESRFEDIKSYIYYQSVEVLRHYALTRLCLTEQGEITYTISLAKAIRDANQMDERTCPKCEKKSEITRELVSAPKVFTIGFIWPTNSPPVQHILELMQLIDTKMAARKIFDKVTDQSAIYALRGMVCYYAQHYVAFVKNLQTREWLSFDDEVVKKVGNWKDVIAKCQKGHFQPFLMFYERIQ